MQSHINLIVISTGVRLDLLSSETIELNMGGLSLLSLEDRTLSYTNTFKLPRTSTNETQLSFASQAEVRKQPVISCYLECGLIQDKVSLTVKSFDNGFYNCSITFSADAVIEVMKNTTMHDLYNAFVGETLFTTQGQTLNDMLDDVIAAATEPYLYTKHAFIASTNKWNFDARYLYDAEKGSQYANSDGTTFIWLSALLKRFEEYSGYEVTGSLLTDADFLKCAIQYNDFYFGYINSTYDTIKWIRSSYDDVIYFSDVLKVICQMFFADMKITGRTITLNKVPTLFANNGIEIDGFSKMTKTLYSGYALTNYILYDHADDAKKYYGSDTFTADGTGSNEVISLKSYVPETDSVGYVTTRENMLGKILIFSMAAKYQTCMMTYQDEGGNDLNVSRTGTSFDASLLTMSGYYSGILNDILTTPIIFDVETILTPYDAFYLLNNRILTSMQLGGKYFVEEMQYNLTKGTTKLKLIKL